MEAEMLQKVKELRDKGGKRKEIAKQLNLSVYQVGRALAKLKKMDEEQSAPQPIAEERLREIIREELEQKEGAGAGLPVVLKTGKGQEVISPEGIMKYYLTGDGDTGAAMLKGMMLLRAAQMMVMTDVEIMKGQADAQAAAIKPILDIMEKAREDMDAAAQRAKESGAEMAAEAAAGAAAKAVIHIDQKFEELKKQKVDLATVENPMQGFMARAMESMWERMLGIVTPGQTEKIPGLIDERPK